MRNISALHTAADAAQAETCLALFARVEDEFRKLEEAADPGLLKAAHQYEERYT